MFYEIVLDSGEKANKCTIVPLADRADFRLIRVKGPPKLGPLEATVLLHHEGECLTTLRQKMGVVSGIAAIDCVWRRLPVLHRRLAEPVPVLARIPDGFETAYPRRSAKETDPSRGLATIEAIFIASALLGRPDTTLLAKYYFGAKFLEMNQQRFATLGVLTGA